jgi:hypothetical protein
MRFRIEFQRSGGKIVLEADSSDEMMHQLEGIVPVLDRVSVLSLPESAQTFPSVSRSRLTESASDMLRRSKATSINDKIAVLVYFMWKGGRAEKVNIFDLKAIFGEVLESPPKNFTAFMNYLSSKGLVMPSGKKDNVKCWSISSTGLAFVEKELLGLEAKSPVVESKTPESPVQPAPKETPKTNPSPSSGNI